MARAVRVKPFSTNDLYEIIAISVLAPASWLVPHRLWDFVSVALSSAIAFLRPDITRKRIRRLERCLGGRSIPDSLLALRVRIMAGYMEERLQILRPILLGGLFATLATCAHYARRATLIAEAALDRAHQRSEELLLNILPPSIAQRLKASGGTIADGFTNVSVLFADIVGFTRLSSRLSPERIVNMLNELFCKFDDLAGQLGLEKIKTIGDCYMVAGGLPEPRADHAEAVAEMGLLMLGIVGEMAARTGEPLTIRIGIHSGPVVAGVIGKRKFIYDLWGDTVNIASRVTAEAGASMILVDATTFRRVRHLYDFEGPQILTVKGKGEIPAYRLMGRKLLAERARGSMGER